MADIDQLGPVDWLVLEFPGKQPTGQVAPYLKDLVDRGLVTSAGSDGPSEGDGRHPERVGVSDLDPSELGEIRTTEADLAMVLSEQDVLDLAETLEPGSTAAVLVWENLWAAPFGSAVRKAGGQLVATGRIPTQAVIAAIEADAAEELDMPMAARRRRRRVAAVGGAVVVAHGHNRRADRRDDRRDRRDDRRGR